MELYWKVTHEEVAAAKAKYGSRRNAMRELGIRVTSFGLRNLASWKDIVRFERSAAEVHPFVEDMRTRQASNI